MEHLVSKECDQKIRADYKGYSEPGFKMDHHTVLNGALIVARFQVQVVKIY
jgi:hypothetical protein